MLALIITAFNEELFLPRVIKTLKSQSKNDFFIIFVDNGSTDRTGLIIKSFVKKRPLTVYILEPKRGQVNALKTGINVALTNPEISEIALSDSDAIFEYNWSNKVASFFKDNPKTNFGYATEYFIESELNQVPNFKKALSLYTDMQLFVRKNIGGFMNTGSSFFRREVFTRNNYDQWGQSIDTLLTLKLMRKNLVGSYCDVKTAFSPRRLLDNGNTQKWCQDKDTREKIILKGKEFVKPIRSTGLATDIPSSAISKSLIVKSERLFRRLLILAVFESSKSPTILKKMETVLSCSEKLPNYKNFKTLIKQIRETVLKKEADTKESYEKVNSIIMLSCDELIKDGGALLRQTVFKNPAL